MSISDGYCTLAELKAHANITTNTRDSALEAIITAVSRDIDSVTGHNFAPQASATARVFSACEEDLIETDDFYDTASLVVKTDPYANGTFSVTWASTDYVLEPHNGITKGRAVWRIRRRTLSTLCFPESTDPLVQVTAKWGWVSVPAPIKTACLLQANRLANRPQSALGMVQSPDFGTQDRLSSYDPDVQRLLRPFMRFEVPL